MRRLLLALLALLALTLRCGAEDEEIPHALAPGLEYSGDNVELPRSRAHVSQQAASLQLFVDCDAGSDSARGTVTMPFRTLTKAQVLVRSRSSPTTTGATVTVKGTCELAAPLRFDAADSGASAAAPVVWKGVGGALISGGGSPTGWGPVAWPGAPNAAVFSADVNNWPIPIKTLRAAAGSHPAGTSRWVERSRWPKKVGDNYSTGWLAILAAASFNGPNSCLLAGAPSKQPAPGVPPNNENYPCFGGGWLNATNIGANLLCNNFSPAFHQSFRLFLLWCCC